MQAPGSDSLAQHEVVTCWSHALFQHAHPCTRSLALQSQQGCDRLCEHIAIEHACCHMLENLVWQQRCAIEHSHIGKAACILHRLLWLSSVTALQPPCTLRKQCAAPTHQTQRTMQICHTASKTRCACTLKHLDYQKKLNSQESIEHAAHKQPWYHAPSTPSTWRQSVMQHQLCAMSSPTHRLLRLQHPSSGTCSD